MQNRIDVSNCWKLTSTSSPWIRTNLGTCTLRSMVESTLNPLLMISWKDQTSPPKPAGGADIIGFLFHLHLHSLWLQKLSNRLITSQVLLAEVCTYSRLLCLVSCRCKWKACCFHRCCHLSSSLLRPSPRRSPPASRPSSPGPPIGTMSFHLLTLEAI